MISIGICIGASTVSLAAVNSFEGSIHVMETRAIPHDGNPRAVLAAVFVDPIVKNADKIAVTGRRLRHLIHASSLSEPEAVEAAYRFHAEQHGSAETVVSAGGETFMVYRMDETGRVVDVHTGNKCASGTGEFFLQQLKRMNVSVTEAMDTADSSDPYPVAGRCSVFCKSDCTHALNKGAPKARVIAGLCEMMAGKIAELLRKEAPGRVLVVGGSSSNRIMTEFLEQQGFDILIPDHACSFEALGAALWASENDTLPIPSAEELFSGAVHGFVFHPPLVQALSHVRFMESHRDDPYPGDVCILGLDVGSTTTKAILMRKSDHAVLAGCYLRTNGDPVDASRRCYRELDDAIKVPVTIIGLGVTGSGRQIAGLHAGTSAIINEILAHARAAAYYEPEVDTLFEIGGQDAKYTSLTHGVASDYAMNEACSAGTGSFLEEAASESLNLKTEEIGPAAMTGKFPPNFNDQCAAFIGSDIKTAIQSGLDIPDIAAGLVYSICLNYLNRVKGNRPVGRKVFMQGGVCYNRAVPVAMAALTGCDIIVPPEPGLTGAFGVALETLSRIELKLLDEDEYTLTELSEREVSYDTPFICAGGKEGCDRKCSINRIRISGKIHPFGGACNKYYNLTAIAQHSEKVDLDLVSLREHYVFHQFGENRKVVPAPGIRTGMQNEQVDPLRIGINRTLMVHTLFPFYHAFFKSLGYQIVMGDGVNEEGCESRGAAFCYPMEQAHGALHSLLEKRPDVLFLPHVKGMPIPGGSDVRVTCPFVQAETYTLSSAFPALAQMQVFSPVLDMTNGYDKVESEFLEMATDLHHSESDARHAFREAVAAQTAFHIACLEAGAKALAEISENLEETAIVLFGRPYNAYAGIGNMGIPRKFSSRGYRIIPQDFLPVEEELDHDNMYWASGQTILKAARYATRHPQLFGVYVTNFSCGPDSFLVPYFREIMHQRPSLTLELDSHTADAGIDTRVEAFLDVVRSHIERSRIHAPLDRIPFTPASLAIEAGKAYVTDSSGRKVPLTDPSITVLIPSMGDMGARFLAASLRYVGVNAVAAVPPGEKEMKIGRVYASCKECLPLILTAGSLMRYVREEWNGQGVLVNFMPETSGPCRFGQYSAMMRELTTKERLENVTLLSLTSENGYAGFGVKFALRAWQGVVMSDLLDDVYSAILALAQNPETALEIFHNVADTIEKSMMYDNWQGVCRSVRSGMEELARIPRNGELSDLPSVALVGEIYVRRDGFSRQNLVERFSREGIWVKVAPVSEWLHYCDYIVQNRLVAKSEWKDRVMNRINCLFKDPYEKMLHKLFLESGFFISHPVDIKHLVSVVSNLVSPRLTGETILTVGAAIAEVAETVDGVLAIGPFGCMPARISEAVITQQINNRKRLIAKDTILMKKIMKHHPAMPFLSIETDGSTFPQMVESRLESFQMQIRRMHKTRMELRENG